MMNAVLALKLVLVPSLIGGVTLAGRRWGPGVAGWLSAFPVVSAPILFFIAIEHGAPFAAHASAATLSAVLAMLAFGMSYAWSAVRYSWRVSTPLSFLCYFSAVAALDVWAPSLPAASISVAVALVAAPHLYPKPTSSSADAATAPRQDIWWRMIAGAVLVLLVTHFSARLGPRLSGLFAMFPVMASVLAVFSHIHHGTAFTVKLMRSMVLGYYAFACFCLILSLALQHVSIVPAFLASLGAAVLVQAASRIYSSTRSVHTASISAAPQKVVEYVYNDFCLNLPGHWRQILTPQDCVFDWYSEVEAASITISVDFFEIPEEKAHLFAEKNLSSRLEALEQSSAKLVTVLNRSIKLHPAGAGLELNFAAEVEADCTYLYLGYVTSRKIFNFTLVGEPDKIAALALYDKMIGNLHVKLP